jgi:hypothetical protein
MTILKKIPDKKGNSRYTILWNNSNKTMDVERPLWESRVEETSYATELPELPHNECEHK